MAIPDNIKTHKPDTDQYGATEIRCIKDHFYVYEISSKWDPQKNRPKKVTGKCIGKITEKDGFIPNANCLRMYETISPVVRTYGVFEMFDQLGEDISDKLKEVFPDIYREIRTVALLRLVYGCTPRLMKRCFEDSYLVDLYPDIGTCDKTVRRLVSMLGADHETEIEHFMKMFVSDQSTVLIDGTSIFTKNSDSFSRKGYNPRHIQDRQARLLYLFDSGSHAPVFYRMVPGNIADKAAMADTVIQSGVKNCTVIADKGFYSKKNVSFLMEKKLNYILPLQRNTKLIREEFERTPDEERWDGQFVFKGRVIWYHKEPCGDAGNYLYVFRDDAKKAKEDLKTAQRIEDAQGEKVEDMFADRRKGIFAFISNKDEDAKEIYLAYKERWDIEQCFDYLKNSVDIGPASQRSNESMLGWTFINHVSLLYFYSLVLAIRKGGLNNEWTPNEIIMMAKNIYKIYTSGVLNKDKFIISEVSQKDIELFHTLGVDLLRN
ncbi:MAG: transposase [Lachnospiraceae bacterium]|nr:transposase [Lachnospiraceae bacterium]